MTRSLRALFVANDGFSLGHVTRTIAIAQALVRRAAARSIAVTPLLATTSEAHDLVHESGLVAVRLPAPARARARGFSDDDRRRVVRGALEGIVASFGPDLLVVDTFPLGPHDELAGLVTDAKRVLVRRTTARAHTIARGLDAYALAIIAGDPGPIDAGLPIPCVPVPPITHVTREQARSRDEARVALQLESEGRAVLVAAGGGGDAEAVAHAETIARTLAKIDPNLEVIVARGPLADPPNAPSGLETRSTRPLGPNLSAYDLVFGAAGYNLAHELAAAAIPAALWAEPRPFDDQRARAERFVESGHACFLPSFDEAAIRAALHDVERLRPRPLVTNGAVCAADALLDLMTRGAGG